MEKDNLFDNFEKLLKEKSDEFRLYPSAKVWYSLYNNIHPGRKWPSLAMSTFLLIGLFAIGYLNSNTKNPLPSTTTKIFSKNTIPPKVENSIITNPAIFNNKPLLVAANNSNTIKKNIALTTFSKESFNNSILEDGHYFAPKINDNNELFDNQMELSQPYVTSITNTITIKNKSKTEQFYQKLNAIKNEFTPTKKQINNTNKSQVDIATKSKFGIQIYASPSMGYGGSNTDDKNATTNTIIPQPSLGLEVGASMQYALLKIMKLKTGLQLNYNTYSETNLNQQKESLKTDGIFNDTYPVNYRNETYQISMPVGVEVKLLGNKMLKWNVGATIQPTYVMGINGNSLNKIDNSTSSENNWNLNAGFETFLTYKLKGLTWQLGPQFRYRFLTGYNKNYYIPQSTSNYGVKFGVSKTLR